MYYDAGMREDCKWRAKEAMHKAFWPSMLAALICLVPIGAATISYELAVGDSAKTPELILSVLAPAWIIYTLVDTFLLSPIVMGAYFYFVHRVRNLSGGENPSVFEVFSCFESGKKYFTAVKLSLLLLVYNTLWSLLIIPVIFVSTFTTVFNPDLGLLVLAILGLPLSIFISAKTSSYTGSYVLLTDHPDMGVRNAVHQAAVMFKGHLWELFVFGLSFLGWILLSIITFGVVSVYCIAYCTTAFVCYVDAINPDNQIPEQPAAEQPPIL